MPKRNTESATDGMISEFPDFLFVTCILKSVGRVVRKILKRGKKISTHLSLQVWSFIFSPNNNDFDINDCPESVLTVGKRYYEILQDFKSTDLSPSESIRFDCLLPWFQKQNTSNLVEANKKHKKNSSCQKNGKK